MKGTRSINECNLSVEKLKEYLQYYPEYGYLKWIKKPNKNILIGRRAGTQKTDGYRYIRFDNFEYMEHRLIWFYMTEEWPKNKIDHEDLNKANNIWVNLREATTGQNSTNTKTRKDNSTGYKGITKYQGKFRVRINVDNKEIYLGSYKTFEEALAIRLTKENELHGEYRNKNW